MHRHHKKRPAKTQTGVSFASAKKCERFWKFARIVRRTRAGEPPETRRKIYKEVLAMQKDVENVLRTAGLILLGLFVLVVGVPLVLAAAGLTLGILGKLFALAVFLIKLAVFVAIGYLVLVAVRTLLK
jgi:hypothetical protein